LVRVPVVADEFVTTTLTAPAACAGVVAVIEVSEFTVKLEAAVPPKVTAAPVVVKKVPVIVTDVPPAAGPEIGFTEVTVGAWLFRKLNDPELDEPPPGLLTVTALVPVVVEGVIALIEVSELTVKLAAATPAKVTELTPVNPVPVMATWVPPCLGPDVGVKEVMFGGITKVN